MTILVARGWGVCNNDCVMTNNELATHHLANQLMEQHGLKLAGWRFKLNTNRSRLGVCRYTTRSIELSTFHVSSGNWKEIKNTILHEIAHALVGPNHGHGAVWRSKALAIGCNGERCGIMDAPPKYKATCSCGRTYKRNRISKYRTYFCPPCSTSTNRKKLEWKKVS